MINQFIINKLTKNPLLIKGFFFTFKHEKKYIYYLFVAYDDSCFNQLFWTR